MTKEQRQEKIDNHVATVANKIADHMQRPLIIYVTRIPTKSLSMPRE